jgi:hypothetical protein
MAQPTTVEQLVARVKNQHLRDELIRLNETFYTVCTKDLQYDEAKAKKVVFGLVKKTLASQVSTNKVRAV